MELLCASIATVLVYRRCLDHPNLCFVEWSCALVEPQRGGSDRSLLTLSRRIYQHSDDILSNHG